MVRSKRLAPISKVAGRREQDAARSLAASRRHAAACEAQVNELKAYRKHYLHELAASGGTGVAAARAKEYRTFIAQIDAAIAQGESRLMETRNQCRAQMGLWLSSRTRSRVVNRVIDRYRQDERAAAERAEQNQSDDRAQHRPGPSVRGESEDDLN